MTALLLAVGGGAAAAMLVVGVRMARADVVDGLAAEDLVLLRPAQRRRAQGQGPLQRLARRLVPSVRRGLSPRTLAALQRRIDEAGRPDGLTVDLFLQKAVWWALLISPVAVMYVLQGNALLVLLCLAVPVVLPLSRVAVAQRRRQERIDRDLPDFLDVLAVTVMAGVSFRVALARVADRFAGPLGDEITLTLQQIANGASVRDAFTALRERTSSEPVAKFVSALLQSQELGAPLAESLRQIAEDMRKDSAQRQRRAAARTAPRVTLVTSMVLVPGVLVLVLVGVYLGANVDFGQLFGGAG